MFARLSWIGLAKADHPDSASYGRKAQYMQTPVQITDRHKTPLRVSATSIFSDDCGRPIEIVNPVKAQSSRRVVQIGDMLLGVKVDFHVSYCIYK